MKECFECGALATEKHHVIPRSMGGTKTVPLCARCHMKVHGLENTRRAESSPELTKRGIDKKNRVWELFAVYQAIFDFGAKNSDDINKVMLDEFNFALGPNRIETLKNRINEMDSNYLNVFFQENIGDELSHVWNEERWTIYLDIQIQTIKKFVESGKMLIDEKIEPKLAKKIHAKINKEFLKKIKNQ